MPNSLAARLLCAADQAYDVAATGLLPYSLPRPAAVGYSGPPEGFVSGPDAIDAGLVGEADDGIIVAFRGTLPPDSPNHAQVIRDWVNNINALLVAEPGLPGLVHEGFRNSLNNLWGPMSAAILTHAAASPAKPVYITGHSKGGAMAHLAAVKCAAALTAAGRPNPVIICTFAAARSGDQDFADGYAAQIPNSTRYEYTDDIVPHLPPEDAFRKLFQTMPVLSDVLPGLTQSYIPVGELLFINWDGKVVSDSPGLTIQRFAHLSERLLAFDFEDIVADHGIGPGSGYAAGVGLTI